MLMIASVVAIVVEYDLPIVWVVCNNNSYSSIRSQQEAFF